MRRSRAPNGLDLGEFRIRAYYPDKSQKSTASFAMYATVTKDKLAESQHLLENRLNKLRDQMIVVTRLMPLADFDDPELKNFRRRILLQLRRTCRSCRLRTFTSAILTSESSGFRHRHD